MGFVDRKKPLVVVCVIPLLIISKSLFQISCTAIAGVDELKTEELYMTTLLTTLVVNFFGITCIAFMSFA